MENRTHSKVFNFSLKLAILLIQLIASVTSSSNQVSTTVVALQRHSYEEFNLKDRMSEIEAKSQRQENDIALLKAQRVEDKKFINQLSHRVEQLEALVGTENILSRQKRPFRLVPVNLNR